MIARSAVRDFHKKVASEITSRLRAGKVLDIGTGPGHLLLAISRQNPDLNLTGCDLSKKMLKIAEKVTSQQNSSSSDQNLNDTEPSRISFTRGDVQDLPFADGEFDQVVSTLSMHHWSNPVKGIRECARVTAPGGCCWIYDLRTDAPLSDHAELLSVKGLKRLILSWVFKFHGVDTEQYRSLKIDPCLDENASFDVEIHPAYLKFKIKKPLSKSTDEATCSEDVASINTT